MPEFLDKLNEELSRFDDESIRNSIVSMHAKVGRKIIRESKEPQEGVYYWVPRADGNWVVWAFPFSLYGANTDHEMVWRNYVAPKIAAEFRVDKNSIIDLFGSVPRGRVMIVKDPIPVIAHGDDSPGILDKVRSEFNLPPDSKVAYWSHETMVLDDYVALCKAIGKDLGLKPMPEDTRWDREDEI